MNSRQKYIDKDTLRRAELRKQGICTACRRNMIEDKYICDDCYELACQRRAKYLARDRDIILEHYGPFCICCKETNRMFLTLDHINNDGAEQRRETGINGGQQFYKWVIAQNFPSDLQILCFNCNCGKQRNRGVCPHKNVRMEKVV